MILLDNYNVTNVEFVTTGQNILACESFEEEHYDIYSIKTVFGDILKESISTHGNSPIIELNVPKRTMTLKVDEATIAKRRAAQPAPVLKVTNGVLFKYARQVKDASEGCVTDAD